VEKQLMSSSQYKKQKSRRKNRGTVNVLGSTIIAKLISKLFGAVKSSFLTTQGYLKSAWR